MPPRAAKKRTAGARKPAARKPARKASTTIVVRRAPRRAPARAASLSVISPYEDEFNCTRGLRGYSAPMTFEELEKRLLAEYACKLKTLCLQKKNFRNALICKYGPKPTTESNSDPDKPVEPLTLNKSEAEYLQGLDHKIDQLKFDTTQRLHKEKFKSEWNKGDTNIRRRFLGPDIDAIEALEKKYGKEENTLLYSRGGEHINYGDPTDRAKEIFNHDIENGSGDEAAHFGDYSYSPNRYESFLDYY